MKRFSPRSLSRPAIKLLAFSRGLPKPLLFIAGFAVIGSTLLFVTKATTPFASIESEWGILCGVTRVIDPSASDDTAVEFGSGQTVAPEDCITGTTYYVDCAAGTDTNNGAAPTTAWKSLAKASSAPLNPGDGIVLKQGCNFAGPLTVSRSGTASSNIIVASYGTGAAPVITRNTNGADVSLTGSYITVRDLNLLATAPQTDQTGGVCNGSPIGFVLGVSIESGASYNTVRNITASGHYAAVYARSGSHHNKILNNTLTNNIMMSTLDTTNTNNDAGAFGVLVHGDDNEVANNQIDGNDACSYDYGRDGAAIEVYGGQRNVIRHNKANNNIAFIELGNSRSLDNTVAYNVATSNLNKSNFLLTRGGNGDVFGPVTGTKVFNNTAYLTGPSSQGVVCYSGCSSTVLTMKNNIMWANWKALYADAAFNESNNIYWKTGGSPLVQNAGGSTVSSTSKKVDPLFVNITGGDFHLKSGSPAIDAGTSESVTAGFNKDLENKNVPSGTAVDMGAYEFTVNVTDPTPAPTPSGPITIAVVGDMNPSGNTSTSSPSGKNATAIIAGLNDGSLNAFFGLGDFQYTQGTCSTLVSQWAKLWGPVVTKTYHIAGPTHDAASATDELGYRNFFDGACPGSSAKSAAVSKKGSSIGPFEAYSFDLGNWHFAMMPTAALRYNTQSASELATWLDNDLSMAKAAGKHLAVAYHDPYFTSSTSSHQREIKVKPWIDIMDKHDVRLTLSASQHNYERSCPVLANDSCTPDEGFGMTAFQVSTGGISLRSFTDSPAYILKRFADTHGWLKLTLFDDGSFSWSFNPVQGFGTDNGNRVKPGR